MNLQILAEGIRAETAVLSFTGWPDAGNLVETALAEAGKEHPFEPVAVWDTDGFWHIGGSRPRITIQHGQVRRLEWPAMRFLRFKTPHSRDILFGTAPEPQCHWRLFTHELMEMLKQWGCRELILLGSLHDQIWHDEVLFSAVASDASVYNQARGLGCRMIEYEGPAAIHSAVMEAAGEADLQCLSVWAHLASYISGPHELMEAHLLRILGGLLSTEFDTRGLLTAWEERLKEIESALQQNQDLVQMLESRERGPCDPASIPSSGKVVRLDEFLKKREHPTPDE